MTDPFNANMQALLDNAAGGVAVPTPVVKAQQLTEIGQAKRDAVEAATINKKGAMGVGVDSAYNIALSKDQQVGLLARTERENDIRDMPTPMLYEKYGSEANNMMLERAAASNALRNDQLNNSRSDAGIAYDTATDIASGAANAVGGMGALAISAATPDNGIPSTMLEVLGTAANMSADAAAKLTGNEPIPGGLTSNLGVRVSDLLGQATKLNQENQSPELNALRGVQEATNALADRDTAIQYEQDVAAGEGVTADLKKIGRDAINAVDSATDDSAVLGSGTATAAGSFAAAGPVSGVLRKGAAELLGTTGKLAAIGQKASGAVALGGIESGGSYTQTANEVMSRSPEELLAESSDYRELIAQGMDPIAAQRQLADDTAQTAAAITAPFAVAAGALTGGFAAKPLGNPGVKGLVGNLVKEPVEEGIQGATGQIAQNAAIKDAVDPDQQLTEGVGRQIGEGALYGLGMSAAIQAPVAAVAVPKAALKGTAVLGGKLLESAGGLLAARADAVQTANEAASPVSDAVVAERAAATVANQPAAVAVVEETLAAMPAEEQDVARKYVDKVMSAAQFDPTEYDKPSVPEATKAAVAGMTSRVQVMQTLAKLVNEAPADSNDQIANAYLMYEQLDPLGDAFDSSNEGYSALPEDSQAKKIMAEYGALLDQVQQSPAVMTAIGKAAEIAALVSARNEAITAENVNTPEGQSLVQANIITATATPDKANQGAIEQILYHAEQGNLQITSPQKAALASALVLLRAVKDANEEAKRQGTADKVSLNITSEKGEKGESVLQHTELVRAAMKSGDLNLAKARMFQLGQFAQSMSNKLGAINTHFASGDSKAERVYFETWTGSQYVPSAAAMGVTRSSEKSIQFAQTVARETKLVVDVFNGLATAFPAIKAKHLVVPKLDPVFDAPAQDVVIALAAKDKPAPAKAPSVSKPTPVIEAVAPTSSLVERAAQMTDEQLNRQLTRIQGNIQKGDSTPETAEKFTILDAEMIKREDAAQAELDAQAEADFEASRKVKTAPVVAAPAVKEPAPTPAPVTVKAVAPAPVEKQSTGIDDEVLADLEAKAYDRQAGPEAEPAQGMAALFPDLIGSVKSWFRDSYKLPEKARTRTIGSEAPMALIRDVLSSSANLTSFLEGIAPKVNFTPEVATAYADLLDDGESLKNQMQVQLDAFLNKKNKAGVSLRDQMTANPDLQPERWANGKHLSIVNKDMTYNTELLEGAVLAGLQWLLTGAQNNSPEDAESISKFTGIPEDMIGGELIEAFNQGTTSTVTKRGLAKMIRDYWGVVADRNGMIGHQEGIAESVAAEMLTAMIEGGFLIQGEPIKLTEADGIPEPRTYNTYKPAELPKGHPLLTVPNAIELAVLTTPEQVMHIGSEVIPAATTGLRSPGNKNSAQQIATIQKANDTEYRLNMPIVALYNAIGSSALLRMFGAGDIEARPMNINDAKSKDGVNRGQFAGHVYMDNLIAQMQNVSEATGVPLDQVPVKFAHNVTKVSRLQQLGSQTPQSNKFIRAALLPTWSNLDLVGNAKHLLNYNLGLAQALGVKIHNQLPATSVAEITALLTGPLAPTVEIISQWLATNDTTAPEAAGGMSDSTVTAIMEGFAKAKVNLDNLALQAVVDYARYNNMTDAAKADFKTAMYIEADGMTNGPIMAMFAFLSCAFESSFVKNVGKGGMFFNRLGMTANEWRSSVDKEDLYKATTTAMQTELDGLRNTLRAIPEVYDHMTGLLSLMDMFFGKDFSFDAANGTFTIERGIAKNPLTITIYGSGAAGIAAKLVRAMTDAMYEKMSVAAQNQLKYPGISLAEAMFGGEVTTSAEADAKMAKFLKIMGELTNTTVYKAYGNLKLDDSPNGQKGKLDPLTFTLTKASTDNLRSAMNHLFVTPMRAAIASTVGQSLLENTKVLQQVTNIQSMVAEDLFRQGVADKMAERAKDPSWKPTDFLSQQDMNEIRASIKHLLPIVSNENQSFDIAGSATADLKITDFGRGANDQFKTDAFISGPTKAGVKAIPFLTLGSGDAQTIQTFMTNPAVGTDTLPIFDGINIPLDKIDAYSEHANAAVFDAWSRNIMKDAHDTLAKFMLEAPFEKLTPETTTAILKTIFPFDDISDMGQANIKRFMEIQVAQLDKIQQSIEVRHAVVSATDSSVDQMAAVGAPYQNKGSIPIAGTTSSEIANSLNTLYIERMEKELPVTRDLTDTFAAFTPHATGVKVMAGAQLSAMANSLQLPADQQSVLKDIVGTLTAEQYKVVAGSASEVAAYMTAEGTPLVSDVSGLVRGFTSIKTKTIYLISLISETLVHELIHAATFEKVLEHYSGKSKLTPTETKAIKRIEALMKQFLTLDTGVTNTETETAYQNAANTINKYLANGTKQDKAAALNEFMAWAGSNEQLVALLKRNKATKLAQIAYDVIEAIKAMFGLTNTVGKDMFSNLQFNTAVLMATETEASVASRMRDVVLFQNETYGNDPRLTQVHNTFVSILGRFLQSPLKLGTLEPKASLKYGIQLSKDIGDSFVAHGFNMTEQAYNLFTRMIAVMATEASISPASMAAAQRLYMHVTKNLTVEMFMKDSQDESYRYYAEQKYNSIMGKYVVGTDTSGRSTLLPAFLALATVDDGFREVLSKMDLPKGILKEWNTLDGILENTGTLVMDSLSTRISGVGSSSTNVKEAIDNLQNHLTESVNAQETKIEQSLNAVGGRLDRMNDYVVNGVTNLATNVQAKATEVAGKAKTAFGRKAALTVVGIAGILSDETGEQAAMGIMQGLNKQRLWAPLHDLMGDLVGRTANNASVYDMIKRARSFIQRARQQYRETLPKILISKFSGDVTAEQWASMHSVLAKGDVAALLDTYSVAQVFEMLTDPTKLDAAITAKENSIQKADPDHFREVQDKAVQLANYMLTGEAGNYLLRNASTVSNAILGKTKTFKKKDAAYIKEVDALISLYAMQDQSFEDTAAMKSLVEKEAAGVEFTLSYLTGLRVEEQRKAATGMGRSNHFKGHVASERAQSASLVIEDDSKFSALALKSYKRIGDYVGSPLERKTSRGYYLAQVSGRARFEQGIMQNIRQTASGVDLTTGYSTGMNAGVITDPVRIKAIVANMGRDTGKETLMPVLDDTGSVVAFERSIDPELLQHTTAPSHLAKIIGEWRGRQVEEGAAQMFNNSLVDALGAMYDKDIAASRANKEQYINLSQTDRLDPVTAEAVSMFNPETKAYIAEVFGEDFYVRRDLLNDALGYRAATVRDFWSGNSRYSKETQAAIRNIAVSVFGNEAYRLMVNASDLVENAVNDIKTLIIVKSVVIPMGNLIANILQMKASGIPLMDIVRGHRQVLTEVHSFAQSQARLVEAEAELLAAVGDAIATRKLEVEIKSINDGHRRLSIWPQIEAGEFSSISDVGLTQEERLLTDGRLHQFIENQVQKLPGPLGTVAKNFLVTKDTALFQGLQLAVEYGDFIAKSITYQDMIGRQGMTKAEALGRVSETFVNYDRLPGRFRGSMEKLGLMWFWNYKIRITKQALSLIRHNPVHTLLTAMLPPVPLLGDVGSPVADNLFSKLAEGSLDNSIGPGMAFRSFNMNPWVNLTQ